jgi:betaine-aldehyde dehydrogenase
MDSLLFCYALKIVQEEIFGPVVVIQKFKDEAELSRLAGFLNNLLLGGI